MARVALIGENSIGYINSLLDIWNDGDCAVLIDSAAPFNAAVKLMREANVKKCLIQSGMWQGITSDCRDIDFIDYNPVSGLTFELPHRIYEKYRSCYENDEAVIIYSSGTTGSAKGIILSHFAISTNADSIIDYMKPSKETDCIYTMRHLSHSSTLTGELLVALKTKSKAVITSRAVPPRLIFSTIKKYGISILGINPSLLSLLCDETKRGEYDISSLKKIYVSGSILSDILYERAKNIFNGIAIYNVYGLSEAAPRVAAQREGCQQTNSVGRPIKGVEVKITDDGGNEVPNGIRGLIHVKTPSLFSGYVTGGKEYASLIHGWLNAGDTGYFDGFGELHIIGRIDDVIICDAHKIYPCDIEKIILEDFSITDCIIAGFDERGKTAIGCLYVSDDDRTAAIIRHLKENVPSYEIPKKIIRVDKIPCGLRGKPDKKAINDILCGNTEAKR